MYTLSYHNLSFLEVLTANPNKEFIGTLQRVVLVD